jgi:lysophospholipase L1-like esterase
VRVLAVRLALPVLAGQRLVAFGDSLTADRRSWAELLRRAGLDVVNLGVPGDTTVHLVGRFEQVAAARPDLLVVLAGTNDARRHGLAADRMLVPDAQTRANLRVLRTLAREQTAARVVFVTPPPILEAKVRRAPDLVKESVSWLAADVDRKARIAASVGAPAIDSRAVLSPPLDRLLLADGLHLSLRGQQRLARWILRCLVAMEATAEPGGSRRSGRSRGSPSPSRTPRRRARSDRRAG